MIRLAVCDDEPYMLGDMTLRLENFMEQKKISARISGFADGNALLEDGGDYDMLFLDIQMRKPDGMETAWRLRERGYDGLIIFITVLKEKVFDAFEVRAFDYLVKPLNDTRFCKTMERALKVLEGGGDPSIMIQKEGGCQVVKFSRIVYCEVLGRKIYLHLQDKTVIDYYESLSELERRLDTRFFKCHRSYLVNLDYVCGYRQGVVILWDGDRIPVSRLRGKELGEALLSHMKERRRFHGLV